MRADVAAVRKVTALLVAGLVLAGCGGSSLPKEDEALADKFWTGLSSLEQETLCERMSTAEGRLQQSKLLSDELPTPVGDKLADEPGDGSGIVGAAKELEANDARAEAIVTYLHDSNC